MAWKVELLTLLNQHHVEFLIVGGIAAVTYGSARLTEDLDICAPLSHANVLKIIEALADVKPRWRMRPDMPVVHRDNPLLANLKNMYLRTDLGQLDVLGELTGVGTYAELFPKSEEKSFLGVRCRVVDLDSLIESKRRAGRPKDIPAVQELELIRDMLKRRKGP